jgi:hypothetical protein
MSILKKTVMTLACLACFALSTHASASNIYVAQNSSGSANGADCADAKPVSFFNSSGNWGSGSAQIGPGTTVHLCGTFTGAAGSTMLTIQGSGSSGNPITILFESGAQLNAPYWGNGAIYCNGPSFITVDGGTNGTIQNTANGTNLTNQASSSALVFSTCSGLELRNLIVSNIYVRASGDQGSDGNGTTGISITGGDLISIHNNTISNARTAIAVAYGSTLTSLNIYQNTTDYHCWGILVGDGNGNSRANGINVYKNTIGPHFAIWGDAAQSLHADGIIFFAANPGSIASANIYNNYFHGDMCNNTYQNCTAFIFTQGVSNTNIFNNLIVYEGSTRGPESDIRLGSSGTGLSTDNANINIYNNTFVGSIGVKTDAGSGITIKNNIFSTGGGILAQPNSLSMMGSSDYNIFNVTSWVAASSACCQGTFFNNLANWQAQGFDSHSSASNPLLSSIFSLSSGSPASTLGTNLTSVGLLALNSDKNGNPRPTIGPWAVGAFQTSGNVPAPPSSLTATVQ